MEVFWFNPIDLLPWGKWEHFERGWLRRRRIPATLSSFFIGRSMNPILFVSQGIREEIDHCYQDECPPDDWVNPDAPPWPPPLKLNDPRPPQRTSRKRLAIPAGRRFAILARDGFRCRYCGRSPMNDPEVVLHVDHIHPRILNGEDDDANYAAACLECNLGKADRPLSSFARSE